MVKHISDRIGVMYLGSLVELADSEELFENPMHPYTKALLSAIPIPDPDIEKNRQRIMLEGTLPNPIDLGEECKFCSRCPVCKDSCHKSQPKLVEEMCIRDRGRTVSEREYKTGGKTFPLLRVDLSIHYWAGCGI